MSKDAWLKLLIILLVLATTLAFVGIASEAVGGIKYLE